MTWTCGGEVADDGFDDTDELVVGAVVGQERDRVVAPALADEPIDGRRDWRHGDARGDQPGDAVRGVRTRRRSTSRCCEAIGRHGGEWGLDELRVLGRRAGDPEVMRWAELANANSPDAAHPRPLRTPRRRRRVPPRVPRADAPRRSPPASTRRRGQQGPHGRPCRARREVLAVEPGRAGPPVPDLDDVLDHPGAARRRRPSLRSGSRSSRRAATTAASCPPPRSTAPRRAWR